jgi:prohibitin 1
MARPLGLVYRWAVPLALGTMVVQSSIYDVKGGTRAVIFDRISGIIYDVRTKPRNISTTTGSKDLQMVSLTLRVLHRPEVQKLPKIYQVSSFCLFPSFGVPN